MSYFHEVRISGETGEYIRGIIHDVADTFDVEGAVRSRPVPHITLFGPYKTDDGLRAKRIVEMVCSGYDIVPYRLDGFGHFGDNVIYIDVVPSPELRQLRRELSKELRKVGYDYPKRELNKYYSFHVTVAFKDIENKFETIWKYLNQNYEPDRNEYATRVTTLDGRRMMHEWDLIQGQRFSPSAATSYQRSWKRTLSLLSHLKDPRDHDGCKRKNMPQKARYKIECLLRG